MSFSNMLQVRFSKCFLHSLFNNFVVDAVTSIPETSFNHMHGKIADLKTEDAQKFTQNHLNEIGKNNYMFDQANTTLRSVA